MVLKDKIRATKMSKTDTAVTYLTKITHVHDELSVVREIVPNHKMVWTTLNGVTKPWKVFVEGIVAWENMPKWECMWDDFIQEDIQRGSLHETQQVEDEKKNLALARKRKGKAKKLSGGATSQNKEKQKDMSKVKCFTYKKYGHFASQSPYKSEGKGKQQMTTSTEIDNFAERFEKEFSLMTCMFISMSNSGI